MRDHNEFCAEINRRKNVLKEKKKQHKRLIVSGIGAMMCVAIVAIAPWQHITPPEIGGEHGEKTEKATDVHNSGKFDSQMPDEEFDNQEECTDRVGTHLEASTEMEWEEATGEIMMPSNVLINSSLSVNEYYAPYADAVIEFLLSNEYVILVSDKTEDVAPELPEAGLPDAGLPETELPDVELPESETTADGNIEEAFPDHEAGGSISVPEINTECEETESFCTIIVTDQNGRSWVFDVDFDNIDEVVRQVKDLCR